MLSLYIHIPFCANKCNYCSFTSFVDQKEFIPQYIDQLLLELDYYKQELGNQEIKSIYFGGGTPNLIGAEGMERIINHISTLRDSENLMELSIEMNPYPQEEIYAIIQQLNRRYRKFPRIRYSFGIQSLDDEVLKWAGRPSTFPWITDFLRGLRTYKQDNTLFNFDFIAFGKLRADGELRNDLRMDFFEDFVESRLAESFSLYTIELHEGSKWFVSKESWIEGDDAVMQEFGILKDIITDAGYLRYEISNFAKAGCASIHNMVYRNMENYLGVGVSASSFLRTSAWGKRWTNTHSLEKYLTGNWIDEKENRNLDTKDLLIEEFFLKLRTSDGIADIKKYQAVLVDNYEALITSYTASWLSYFDGAKLQLSDTGMNLYNSIVTDLLKNI